MEQQKTADRPNSAGFTLVELTVSIVVFAAFAVATLALLNSLVRSTIIAKRQAVASSLATNQMEYLKSLPYDSLAVVGGSIYATSPIPATATKTMDGVKYTIKTSINYVDDAYDGCAAYPSQALKELYCRNYPPPTGSPATDTNPQDYKVAHVTVSDTTGSRLAEVDTQMSSRVSETSSTTGALFVSVIDGNGNKVSGATVGVSNTTITPNANVSDTTDVNGTAIFYGLPPDSGTDYVITATKSAFSSLTTISASGSLQATYPSQKILTQQSSFVTLTIKPQSANSLIVESTDVSGTPIPNMRVYIKGGYKKYTLTTDTAYYYDNMTPGDVRPTADASGLAVLQNLTPGQYIFCGDAGATNCKVGNTTYYLVAAVPYGGTNPFNPVAVPSNDGTSTTTFDYGGSPYVQKVRLLFATQSNFPRINVVTPSNISAGTGPVSNFTFTISGTNLPCSSTASACGTTVKILQGSNTYTASCTGTSGTLISCKANVTGVVPGNSRLQVTANSLTVTTPGDPLIGGVVVLP